MTFVYKKMNSPVGELKLIASDHGLAAILWENDSPKRVNITATIEQPDNPILVETKQQLEEYFQGRRQQLTVALDFHGTEFQKKVWQALLTIPYGKTITYGQLAALIGNPRAARAVGAAAGRNPISIIAPCHRVVGANGSLTGFAGGVGLKARLLEIEALSGK